MQILVLIGTVGASPYIGEILPLCDFSDCLVLFSRKRAQVEPLNRFSRFMAQTTCFRVRKCLLGIRTMGDVIWRPPTTLPPQKKVGVNKQFQAKTAKYKNSNISETINPIKTKCEDQPQTNNCTSRVV